MSNYSKVTNVHRVSMVMPIPGMMLATAGSLSEIPWLKARAESESSALK
jgi:hypothetical protein